ncbi:MAG: hypothetical protein D6784_09365 [Chloroflexi bacterium]|nr:MAG: hypothetical protein D6784_09365 [Chloroflexota bacterium]
MRLSFQYFLCFFLLSLTLLTACGRIQPAPADTTGVQIELAVDPASPAVGPARLLVTLTGPDGQPIDGATVEVEGNMTHAGMTPVFAQTTASEQGRYTVPFEWTMAGDWIVTVRVTLPGGEQVRREFPVRVGG